MHVYFLKLHLKSQVSLQSQDFRHLLNTASEFSLLVPVSDIKGGTRKYPELQNVVAHNVEVNNPFPPSLAD